MRVAIFGPALVAALVPVSATAQALSPELQKLDAEIPGDLISDPTRIDWAAYGEGYESTAVQDPSIPGGGAARRFVIAARGAAPYAIGVNVPLLGAIARGDVVTIGFYARTVAADSDNGQGVIGVRFQQNAAPYAGFGDTVVRVGKEWKWHEVSATADRVFRRGEALAAFQLAGARQTVEIGQTIVVKGAPTIVATRTVTSTTPETELPPQLVGAGQLLTVPPSATGPIRAAAAVSPRAMSPGSGSARQRAMFPLASVRTRGTWEPACRSRARSTRATSC